MTGLGRTMGEETNQTVIKHILKYLFNGSCKLFLMECGKGQPYCFALSCEVTGYDQTDCNYRNRRADTQTMCHKPPRIQSWHQILREV